MPKIYLCHGAKGKRVNGWLSFIFNQTLTLTEFQIQERIYSLRMERFNFSPVCVLAGDELRIWFNDLHNFRVIRREWPDGTVEENNEVTATIYVTHEYAI